MLQILEHTALVRAEWNRLVAQSETGTWFQSPEAYDFFAAQPHLFKPFVWAVADNQDLLSVCVGYVTRESNSLKQFFTRRAIIIGGPAIVQDCTVEALALLMQHVKEQLSREAIYLETRNFRDFSPWAKAFEQAGWTYWPHYNFHIDCTSKDTIWANLSETRCRQIRKALKNGVTIDAQPTEQDIIGWYRILREIYRTRVKTPLFPLNFFLSFYRQGIGRYLIVKYEGRVIGGIMCPIQEEQCIYEWFVCGLDSDYKECYPSVMATYAAMEYGVNNELPLFDVMGAGVPDIPYGVRDFKAEFGGRLVEYGRYRFIAKPLLFRLGVWGVRMLKGRSLNL